MFSLNTWIGWNFISWPCLMIYVQKCTTVHAKVFTCAVGNSAQVHSLCMCSSPIPLTVTVSGKEKGKLTPSFPCFQWTWFEGVNKTSCLHPRRKIPVQLHLLKFWNTLIVSYWLTMLSIIHNLVSGTRSIMSTLMFYFVKQKLALHSLKNKMK